MVRRISAILFGVVVLMRWGSLPAGAQTPQAPGSAQAAALLAAQELSDVQIAPVVIDGATLFRVAGISAFPAESRAKAVVERVREAAADPAVDEASLTLTEEELGTGILANGRPLVVVADLDASLARVSRGTLAEVYRRRIWSAIQEYRADREPRRLIRRGVLAGAGALVLLAGLWLAHWVVRRLRGWLERRYRARLAAIEEKALRLVRAEQVWFLLRGLLGLVWVAGALVAVYAYLYFSLTLFPWTRGLGNELSAVVIEPLRTMGAGAVGQAPALVFLVVLAVVTRSLLKMVALFFDAIAKGRLTLENFDPEWAWPTYRLVRLAIIAFAVVVAYPYIPGSQTDAFKGVSLFIGVIFSLGSTSVIGNAIAGYSMTYRRAFRVGDRIKVGEHLGDVEEIRLMVTHLRTPKNEAVIVPNSTILSSDVVNFTSAAKRGGLILHTTVGIGYETPWRQVEAMLIEAASRTPGLQREPRPFVLQKSLGDFCVVYELNAYCDNPRAMNALYTALHRSILDVFNEYGVQIMTPAYEKDPEQPKVVPKSDWYLTPAQPPDTAGTEAPAG